MATYALVGDSGNGDMTAIRHSTQYDRGRIRKLERFGFQLSGGGYVESCHSIPPSTAAGQGIKVTNYRQLPPSRDPVLVTARVC